MNLSLGMDGVRYFKVMSMSIWCSMGQLADRGETRREWCDIGASQMPKRSANMDASGNSDTRESRGAGPTEPSALA